MTAHTDVWEAHMSIAAPPNRCGLPPHRHSARVTTRAMGACARLAYRGRSMCGIVGLYAKTATTSAELGRHAGRMLVEMGDRGPDSAGLAVYREPLADGSTKLSLHARDGAPDWDALVARLGRETPVLVPPRRRSRARARRGRGR